MINFIFNSESVGYAGTFYYILFIALITCPMPNCFFDKIDPEHKRKGTKTKDYAEFLFNN